MHVARIEDWVVILSVMGCFAALYGSFAFILVRRFIAPKQIQPKLGLMGYLVIAATAFSIGCIAYAFLVEPYQLETTRIELPILPPDAKQITLIQISDLHCDQSPRLEERLVQEIKSLKPDLIAFTGDSINSLDGLPLFNQVAHQLIKTAPTFAVLGDWDFAFPTVNVLGQSGLKVLNGSAFIELKGTKLRLVGANSGSSLIEALASTPKTCPTIAMFHNPDADLVVTKTTEDVDLYLCGHTHGGQLALPFYGALITQSVQGKKFESGLNKVNKMWLYTNRGIGMEGHFPRMRFCSKPELTVFKLIGADRVSQN